MPAHSVRPRPQGGFNQGFGHFNEHLDEEALHSAVQQKSLAQQATLSSQPTTGGSALGHHSSGHSQPGEQPREVGSLSEELLTRPAQDVVAGLKSLFDINTLLEIQPEQDSPETQARKRQLQHNFQKLDQEDQAVVKHKYQQEIQKKQREQEEEQQRKKKAAQAQADNLVLPSSPRKGPIGPGGQKKPAAVMKLEQDRKSLGGPQNVG